MESSKLRNLPQRGFYPLGGSFQQPAGTVGLGRSKAWFAESSFFRAGWRATLQRGSPARSSMSPSRMVSPYKLQFCAPGSSGVSGESVSVRSHRLLGECDADLVFAAPLVGCLAGERRVANNSSLEHPDETHQPQEPLGFTTTALGNLGGTQAPGWLGGLQTPGLGVRSWESQSWVHPRSPEQLVWEVWRSHLKAGCPRASRDTGADRVPTSSSRVFWEGSDCSASLQVQASCPGLVVSQASCLALVASPAWCPVLEVSPGLQVTIPRSPVPTAQLCGGVGAGG